MKTGKAQKAVSKQATLKARLVVLEETWIYESTSSSSLDSVGIDDCHSGAAVLDMKALLLRP